VVACRITEMSPGCRLWFVSGRNDEGKIVSNPSVGYGAQARRYADGAVREFYRVGISGNTTGISVYLMGIEDKTYLSQHQLQIIEGCGRHHSRRGDRRAPQEAACKRPLIPNSRRWSATGRTRSSARRSELDRRQFASERTP
jgi:hypothetical protein